MSIICTNPKCRNDNRERTSLPSDANFCLKCGHAVSEKAIEKQKNAIEKQRKELNNLKSRKLNDANSEIALLKTKLSEVNKYINQFDIDLKVANTDKQTLKIQLENEINKKNTDNNSEPSILIPKWVYWTFCVIGIVFLILLSAFKHV